MSLRQLGQLKTSCLHARLRRMQFRPSPLAATVIEHNTAFCFAFTASKRISSGFFPLPKTDFVYRTASIVDAKIDTT